MQLYIRMAFRNLFRQKRRTSLTGMTVIGGFVLLSLMVGIDEGGYEHIIGLFTESHTGHIQAHHPAYAERPSMNDTLPANHKIADQLAGFEKVRGSTTRIRSGGLAYHEPKSIPVQIVGIDIDHEAKLTNIRQRIQQGRYLEASARDEGNYEALAGANIARVLNIAIGDEIAVVSQGADGSVANDLFTLVGIVGTDDSADRQSLYLSLDVAQEFFMMYGKVHEWMIKLGHPSEAQTVARQLQESDIFDQAKVRPWQELEQEFYQTMQADKKGNRVVNFILVFMISLGVLNTIFMMILERTREYGILKALGTRPSIIFGLIILETALLSGISLIIGMILSLPIHYYLSQHGILLQAPIDMGGVYYDRIISMISPSTIFKPAVYLFTMSILVSLWPAWRASKKDPLIAMSHV
ncbi:MAG: ABC transporter permease [Oligoflexus sp.]